MAESTIIGEIKVPSRRGPMLTFRDTAAEGGLRGATDAENRTKDVQKALVDAVDESAYESGDELVRIHVPVEGEPSVEWLIDDPPEVDVDVV